MAGAPPSFKKEELWQPPKVMPWGEQVKHMTWGRETGAIALGKHTRSEMRRATESAYTLSQPVFLLFSVL